MSFSLFPGCNGTPTSKTEHELDETEQDDADTAGFRFVQSLSFVDRKAEAFHLCKYLLRNQRHIVMNDGCGKPFLISAGQMFGSGKSMMGRYATKALKLYPDILRRLRPLDCVRHSSLFGNSGLLDAYMNSRYIGVELDKTYPDNFTSLLEFLTFALYRAFIMALCPENVDNIAAEFRQLNPGNPIEVIQHFQKKMPGQTFFLHWDEVGVVELDTFTRFFGKEHNQQLGLRMERYYRFWIGISPLLSMEGVYVFVTDKRPAFALIGHGSIRGIIRPTDHRHVVIGSLRPKDIVETFLASSTDSNISLCSYVRVDPSMLGYFGAELYSCTGGLPRLTHKLLEALCNLQDEPLELKNRTQIIAAVDRCYSAVRNYVMPMHVHMDMELQKIYLAFVMMSLFKQSVPSNSEVTLSSGTRFSILDLVERMNIAIDYVRDNLDR